MNNKQAAQSIVELDHYDKIEDPHKECYLCCNCSFRALLTIPAEVEKLK